MDNCDATLAAEPDKSNCGQNIPLRCDKPGKHRIHNDSLAKASFVKIGKGGIVWPSR